MKKSTPNHVSKSEKELMTIHIPKSDPVSSNIHWKEIRRHYIESCDRKENSKKACRNKIKYDH